MAFPLTEEQRRVVEERGGEILVSAAAGSGKTRVLVERLLERVVEEKIDIDRFLVITFTRAAAAELRGRVVEELNRRLAEQPADRWLRRQATLIYKAPISTIHALCGELLREFGHRIALDPDFRLLDDAEAGMLRANVLENVVEGRYENLREGEDFALLLDAFSAGRDDLRLLKIASELHLKLQAYPDPERWLGEMEGLYDLPEGALPGDTPWGRQLLEETAHKAGEWKARLEQTFELCTADPGLEANYLPSLQDAANLFGALEAAARQGWDEVRKLGKPGFLTAGRKKMDRTLPEVEQVKTVRSQAKEGLEELLEPFTQDGAEVVADLRAVFPAVRGLFSLIRDFDAALQKEKTRRRVLDFNDLEHKTVHLLQNEAVAQVLSERYAEVMVDEYQDTNAVQNAIFDTLSGGGRRLFQVGDVKQSIYRFRLADPTIFLRKYRDFPTQDVEEGQPRLTVLTRNFRSRPEVLHSVNDLFYAVLSREVGELDYTADHALYPGAQFPAGENYSTELTGLFSESGEDEEKVPRDLQEARAVARRVRELLESGFRVSHRDGLRPVRAGDIAVLLRSPGSVLHHYARAFAEEGLPWQADGGGDLLGALEIQVALALLRVVDNPRQDVPLIAALRSPVWGMSADRLAQLRAGSPKTDFYTALEAGADRGEEDCAAFLTELTALRSECADLSAHGFLWLLYERTNLLGIFSAMEGGAERRANLLLLYEYARSFEQAGHKGLNRFLRLLERVNESGRGLAGPGGSRGESAVTLLSIHRSKGLEFPVVLVAGLNRQFNRADLYAPLLFHPELGVGPKRLVEQRHLEYPTLPRRAIARRLDREMLAEEMRLLYVAMTRAQEKLILFCALTHGEKKVASLAPWTGKTLSPLVLEGSRSMGEWILLHALSRPEGAELRAIAGGLGMPCAGLESVWDIRILNEETQTERSIPEEETAPANPLPESLFEGYDWVYPYQEEVDLPSKLTATQLKGRDLDREVEQESPLPPKAPTFARPRFLQEDKGLTPSEKGTAMHQAMQFFDFAQHADETAVAAELDRLVERKFLTAQQRSAVPEGPILAFFRSRLGQDLLRAKRMEREFKFSLLTPAKDYFPAAEEGEQVLLQGVIDCWFEDERGDVTVLDFKTDRRPDPAAYAPQVGAYAKALERMTGKRVVRRALYFFADGSTHLV